MQVHAEKYLQVLHELVQATTGPYAMGMLFNMRTIGASNVQLLGAHREFVESLLRQPALKEHAQGVLDLMEGRT